MTIDVLPFEHVNRICCALGMSDADVTVGKSARVSSTGLPMYFTLRPRSKRKNPALARKRCPFVKATTLRQSTAPTSLAMRYGVVSDDPCPVGAGPSPEMTQMDVPLYAIMFESSPRRAVIAPPSAMRNDSSSFHPAASPSWNACVNQTRSPVSSTSHIRPAYDVWHDA